MCGILCLASRQFDSHPSCLDSVPYQCDDANVIRQLFTTKLELSSSDLHKLQNQHRLKHLNDEMIKLGNNIKVDNTARIQEIKLEIDSINGATEQYIPTNYNLVDGLNELIPKVAARGPDYISYNQFFCDMNFQMFSSVLSLRQPFTTQPVSNDRYVVQFNGELYNSQCEHSNDTQYLLSILEQHGINGIKLVSGEYAFVILDKSTENLHFARDSIGKRSLCYKFSADEGILVSSVPLSDFEQCNSNTLYTFDTKDFTLSISVLTDDYESLTPMAHLGVQASTQAIYKALKGACLIRQETIHPLKTTEADLAVLFSGGLDCTVIAALLAENFNEFKGTDNYKIDLLTVGFDNPRTGLGAGSSPDRELSVKSWFHLSKKFNSSNVSFRLIEIDIDYQTWLLHKNTVKHLMYPQQTEMDLSIAIAFYFASNNTIPCQKVELCDTTVSWDEFQQNRDLYIHKETYISLAKVLFSGLGADELFAGYSRHEALFSSVKQEDNPQEQYNQLNELLLHDITVIHERNLGRDDRVVSTWGKELRYPYLDPEFIKLVVNEVGPDSKIQLNWTTTKKGKTIIKPTRKYLLRQVAGEMGLEFVQHELKRAIQFGSKSAKLEIGQSKAKGTDSLK